MEKFKLQERGRRLLLYTNKYIVHEIPKNQKVLRDGLITCIIELNANILRSNINVGSVRNKYQKEIIVNSSLVDMYLTFLKELEIISPKRFISISSQLSEINKMTTGWMNSEKNKC